MEGRCSAKWEEYPFVVHFKEERSRKERAEGKKPYQFTGTIVSEHFILTAAHNLFEYGQKQGVNAKRLTLTFHGDEPSRRGVPDIDPNFHCHGRYEATLQHEPLAFDIALVRVEEPLSGARRVRILKDDSEYPDDTTDSKVVGWNLSGPGELWECPTRFRRHFGQKDTHASCFLTTTVDTKKGDSGGPLLVAQKDETTGKNEWIQIGVHSSKIGSQRQAVRLSHPAIYDWICCEAGICSLK